MCTGIGILTGVFRKVVTIARTSRHSVKDNAIRVAACLGQERTCPDNGALRCLDRADDETDRLNVFRDELSVADRVDRRAI